MGKPLKGEIVVIPFPFSDLTGSKRRPALVISSLLGDDIILCQITTPFRKDGYSIPLTKEDCISGGVDHDCFIRPNCLFTADSKMVIKSAGNLRPSKMDEVVTKIIEIVRT